MSQRKETLTGEEGVEHVPGAQQRQEAGSADNAVALFDGGLISEPVYAAAPAAWYDV